MISIRLFFACRLWSLFCSWAFILPLTARISLASLHPTKPISTTVFAAGRPAQVKWMEDGQQPLLSDLGHMKIHLLAGNSTYLCTIAEDINPLLLSLTVYIPQIIPANYHVYSLRFVPSHAPHHPIYTAPFTILPNPFSYLLASSHSPNPTTTSVSAPSSGPVLNSDITTISRTAGTQAALPNASGKYLPTQQASGTSFGGFEFGMGWRLGRNFGDATVAHTAPRRKTWNLDLEKVKFGLVFLVWPALIGLSLSM